MLYCTTVSNVIPVRDFEQTSNAIWYSRTCTENHPKRLATTARTSYSQLLSTTGANSTLILLLLPRITTPIPGITLDTLIPQ
jgi:hypothetical protein